jgi:hypothetical protein
MKNNNKISKNELIFGHFEQSRKLGKKILSLGAINGSAIISHEYILITDIAINEQLKTTIKILPITRMYKTSKIIDDDNILREIKEEMI